jgi:photosystem II stability/assembly factor-like uncharacterized protein
VFVSEDGGDTWTPRREGVSDDVHHVEMRSPDEWIVACGTGGPGGDSLAEYGGLFYTTDAGEAWTRIRTDDREYARECLVHGRQLYAAANASPPQWTESNAGLYVASLDALEDLGSVPYPGSPESFVISFTASGNNVLAGTNDGRILRSEGESWEQITAVPVSDEESLAYGVTSLITVDRHVGH